MSVFGDRKEPASRASAFNRVQSRARGVPLSESTAKIIQQ